MVSEERIMAVGETARLFVGIETDIAQSVIVVGKVDSSSP